MLRVEPELSSGAERPAVWRDVIAELERRVMGEQRVASPLDKLCAVYAELSASSEPAARVALGLSGVRWERRLGEVLRALDAVSDGTRAFEGERVQALRSVREATWRRLGEADTRDSRAATQTLVEAVGAFDEHALRSLLGAAGSVVFEDPFLLSPVERAVVERARQLLPCSVEFPLADLPLNAERQRDPLEAAIAWGENDFGEDVCVQVLPRAWGVQQGMDPRSSVQAWSVEQEHDQSEVVVRDMLSRRALGVPFDEMAVVCDDPARRAELLAEMRAARIPSVSRADASAAFVAQLRRMAMAFRHAHAPFPAVVWEGVASALLQGPSAAHQHAGQWLAEKRVYSASFGALALRADAPALIQSLGGCWATLVEGERSWPAIFEAARAWVYAFGDEAAWGRALSETWAANGSAVDADAQADLVARARACKAASDALTELERALQRTQGMGAEPSLELVAMALEMAEPQGAPQSRAAGVGAVRIGSAASFVGAQLAVVYLMDMNAECFPPRPAQPPMGLQELESSARQRRAQGRFSAYAALARLSASADLVVAMVPKTGASREMLEPAEGLFPAPTAALSLAPEPSDAAKLRASREWARRTLRSEDPSVLGKLSPSAVLAEATGAAQPIAVTRLERFAVCPFQGYLAAVLGAKEPDREPWLADARELGTGRHEALQVVFDAVKVELSRLNPSEEHVLSAGREAFDAWASRDADNGRGLVDVLERGAMWDMVATALRMAMADADYMYSAGELSFGKLNDAQGPLVLQCASGDVRLHGRIDRVDMARTDNKRLRVVDYKSGTTKPKVGDVGTRMLQAPLYAEALRTSFAAPAHGWAYLYPRSGLQLDERNLSRAEMQSQERVDRVALAMQTAVEAVDRARRGEIAPAPLDGACAHCEGSGVCRYDAVEALDEAEPESE